MNKKFVKNIFYLAIMVVSIIFSFQGYFNYKQYNRSNNYYQDMKRFEDTFYVVAFFFIMFGLAFGWAFMKKFWIEKWENKTEDKEKIIEKTETERTETEKKDFSKIDFESQKNELKN